MFVRISSNRTWDRLKRSSSIGVIDWHYYTDRGIFHIQEISDDTDLTGIKGVKVVKRMPKEELYPAWTTGKK